MNQDFYFDYDLGRKTTKAIIDAGGLFPFIFQNCNSRAGKRCGMRL